METKNIVPLEMNPHDVVRIAVETGRVMLAAGAETYRIEDTILRMIRSRGLTDTEIFVIPTGVIITYTADGSEHTRLVRARTRGIDLEIIKSANEFARQFTQREMPLAEALHALQTIEHVPRFRSFVYVFAAAMGGAFFVPMFGGTITETVIAYIGSTVILVAKSRLPGNPFLQNFFGGMIAAASGVLCVWLAHLLGLEATISKVIIGPLMLLVPGVALVVGIRDIISGELVSGSARLAEVMIVFVALAFGVGIILQASILRGII